MTKTTQYKNTAIGPIPTDWEVKKLGEVAKFINGKAYKQEELLNEGKYRVLRVGNLNTSTEWYWSDLELDEDKYVNNGDLMYAWSASFGPSFWEQEKTIYHYHIWKVLPILTDKSFLYQHLLFDTDKMLLLKQGGTMFHITKSFIEDRFFPLPPLPEQQKIAEVLSTWDKAIQETDAIIKKLEARNKALATSLLTGESRIEAFKNSPSAKLEIKDVAKEISLKNKEDHNYTVFSCTKYNGLVPSLEYFGKKIYSDNLKTYKIIKRNQFAYATNHIEEGSMGILEKEDIGLISPMYTIFEFNENVNLDYIFKMLKSDFYINEYKRRMEGSIDRRGGLRWSAFAQIKINLLTLEEQNAIAEILNTANQEVKYYQQKLEALKLQKKGLMQQLLTGKVRTV